MSINTTRRSGEKQLVFITVLITIVLGLTLAGCVAATSVSVYPGASQDASFENGTARQLRTTIKDILSAPPLGQVLWGVGIRSLEQGDWLYQRNSDVLMVPASAMKIITLATAARKLGWNDRFETTLSSNGLISDGFLNGDLVIQGSGDPTIDDKIFATWAKQLRIAGVHTIGGRIIGNDRVVVADGLIQELVLPHFGAGWSWDDLVFGFAAPIGPLQYRGNVVRIHIEPGIEPGAAANVSVGTPGSSLKIVKQVTTATREEPNLLLLRRVAGKKVLVVEGRIAEGADTVVRQVAVHNPTGFFVQGLKAALIQHGLRIAGQALDIDELDTTEQLSVRQNLNELIRHYSEPLSRSAVVMMKQSDNLYAESILRRLGTVSSNRTLSGPEVVTESLRTMGLDKTSAIVADGSGLSRYNYLTAATLISVLVKLQRNPTDQNNFVSTLPIAAQDGTLKNRMTGTLAAGNVRAKSGSMSQVRSLAGFATTTDGEQIAFAFIANNFGINPTLVTGAIDEAVVAIAAFSRHMK